MKSASMPKEGDVAIRDERAMGHYAVNDHANKHRFVRSAITREIQRDYAGVTRTGCVAKEAAENANRLSRGS